MVCHIVDDEDYLPVSQHIGITKNEGSAAK
jgi:hypothetical protein